MKKALIVTALAGFIRSFLTNDIKLLQGMGYEVHCAANMNHPGAEGMKEFFLLHGVVFHQIPFSSNRPLTKDNLRAFSEVKKLRDSFCFDVVHCHTPIAGAIVRVIFEGKRKQGCRVIYTTHGFYFHQKSSKKTWLIYYSVEKAMSRFSDAIITINYEDYENAKRMHCKNVFHINGVGVDTLKFKDVKIDITNYRETLGISSDDIVVLNIGELSERKNQKVVIEALGLIHNPNIVFVHCGNSIHGDAVKDALIELAQEKSVRIRLLGLRKDIPEICKCADIGTISSTREGLGLAGIEMLASGLPVVGSNVHGIVDYIIDGQNGFLADPLSPEDFANKISRLLDIKTRNDMKEQCYESVTQFDYHVSNNQMEKIYGLICE